MEDVVQRMGASDGDLLRVRKLGNDDAWSLLKKQLPEPEVTDESSFDHLKDIGMQIVRKCDGLPLAIKVMGGFLSTRRPSKAEWENILKKIIAWKENGLHGELNSSVHLSYDDLSPELKQCFLYYSLFSKGSAPSFDAIISMWISEGFIQGDRRSELDQHDLEEIGTEYHQELVSRNLLELHDSDQNIYIYSMHDVVCSFAQFVAREEALVVQKEQSDFRNLLLTTQKLRRLSITLEDTILEWRILENQESLRTLILNCSIKPTGSLASFASLRVLCIESHESNWILDSLCQLRHLRYMRLKQTDISELPEDIHKLKYLEHIALLDCMRLNKLPDSITKLERLRYLAIEGTNVDAVPMGFGAFKKLTTVYGFPAKMYEDWCSLEELRPLCDLRNLSIKYLENVPDNSSAARAMISNKKSLVYLALKCNGQEEVEIGEGEQTTEEDEQRIEAVFNGLCPPPSLEDLFLSRYFGHRPPIWMQAPSAAAFKSLRLIDLFGLPNCNQLPNGLCLMLNLEDIWITDAPSIEVVGPDFQSLASGDGGTVVTRPFPKLKKLVMDDLPRWKEWDWVEEQGRAMAMPALEELRIRSCNLSRLPRGLASHSRHNLRTLYLYGLSILESVENFPSVVEFDVLYCPELKKISGFSKLRKISIDGCPKLELLEGFPVLRSMVLDDEPWEITGTPAVCTPKVYQVGVEPQLPENFTVTR